MQKYFKNVYRNPIYIAYIIAGSALLMLCSAIIDGSSVGAIELAIFRIFNSLPSFLAPLFIFFSTMGTVYFVALVSIVSVIKNRYKLAIKLLCAGILSSIVANFFRFLEFRPKPELIVSNVNVRQDYDPNLGFPSVHVAIVTALALVLYQYLPATYHKYITGGVLLVAASRLYLGADFLFR